MTSLASVLLDTFYHLQRDYGTTIVYTKVGKGDIDPETGRRDTSADRSFPLPAVLTPVGITTEFMLRLIGRVEKFEAVFLIRLSDLPTGLTVETGDFFVHGNLKYRNLQYENFDGVLIGVTGETFS